MHITTPLSKALATTSRHLAALAGIGIETVGDLLRYFPRAHSDITALKDPGSVLLDPAEQTVKGELSQFRIFSTRLGKQMASGVLVGETGSLALMWWRGGYLRRVLKDGMQLVVTGKVTLNGRRTVMYVSGFEQLSDAMVHAGRLVPIYRARGTHCTPKWLREKIFPLLPAVDSLTDLLADVPGCQHYMQVGEAVRAIHFPKISSSFQKPKNALLLKSYFSCSFLP